MKTVLGILVSLFTVGAFADGPAQMSCDWTDAQGTQILQNFAGIVYKSVQPGLVAKGVAAPANPEINLYKDTQVDASGNAYNILLIEFALADGTKLIVTTDSVTHSLPLTLMQQSDAQGNISACNVQTKDLIIQKVLDEATWSDVLVVNQTISDQMILQYAPHAVQQ